MHNTRLRVAGTAIALVVTILLSGSAAAQNFLIGSWQIRDGTILAVPIIGLIPGETLVFHAGGIRGSRVTSDSRDPSWYEIVGDYAVRSPDSVTFAGIGIGPLPVQFNCRLISATTAECGAAIGAITIVRSPLTMEQLRELETRRRAEIEQAEAERQRAEAAARTPRTMSDQELADLMRRVERPPPSAPLPADPSPSNPGLSVARSQMGVIVEHIQRFWNFPVGIANRAAMVVRLRIRCQPDGTVIDSRVEDQARYRSDATFRAVADSALRALRMASPLPIPGVNRTQFREFVLDLPLPRVEGN